MKVRGANACCTQKNAVRNGTYRRRSDRREIRRYKCTVCKKTYSSATNSPAKHQKRRDINGKLVHLLTQPVSLRKTARLLGVTYKTVRKHVAFLGKQSKITLQNQRQAMSPASDMLIYKLATIENAVLKPLVLGVAVDNTSGHVMGVSITQMPTKRSPTDVLNTKYNPCVHACLTKYHELPPELAPTITSRPIECDSDVDYSSIVTHLYSMPHSHTNTAVEHDLNIDASSLITNHHLAMCIANLSQWITRIGNTFKNPNSLLDRAMILAWIYNKQILSPSSIHLKRCLIQQLLAARSKP